MKPWAFAGCVLLGGMIACGRIDIGQIPNQMSTEAGQSLADESQMFGEGSVIDLASDSSLESIEVVSRLQTQCSQSDDSQGLMECDESSSQVSHDQVEIRDGKVLLKKEGDYLCRVKIKGQAESKIIRLKVTKPTKPDIQLKSFKMIHQKIYGEEMVYQFKLIPEGKILSLEEASMLPRLQVEWKVDGGSSEFVEDQLKYSTKLHLLGRTIHFLDRALYTVTAIVHGSQDEKFTATDVLDLRLVSIPTLESKLNAHFELEKNDFKVEEVIQLRGQIDKEENLTYEWKVKTLRNMQCPAVLSELEDVRMKGVAEKIEMMCGQEVEENTDNGGQFELRDASQRDAQVIFYKKGNYAIEFEAAEGDVTSKFSRKVSVSNGVVYDRDQKKYKVVAYTKWAEPANDAKESLNAEICGMLRFDGGLSMPEPIHPAGPFRYEWDFQDPDLKPLKKYFSNGSCIHVWAPKEGSYIAHVSVFKEYDDVMHSRVSDHPVDIIVVDREQVNIEIKKPFYDVSVDRLKAKSMLYLGKEYIGAKIRVSVILKEGSYSAGPIIFSGTKAKDASQISYIRKDDDSSLMSIMPVSEKASMFDDQIYRPDNRNYERYRFEVNFTDERVQWLRHIFMNDFYFPSQWMGRFAFPEEGSYKVSIKIFCKKGDKPETLIHDASHAIWIKDVGDKDID